MEEPHLVGGHACSEGIGAGSGPTTPEGFSYCPKRVQLACNQVQKAVGASSVFAIDVSTFRYQKSTARSPAASTGSPRTSFYPQSPWISSPLTPPAESSFGEGSEGSGSSLKRSKSRPHFRSISSQISSQLSNQTPTSEDGDLIRIPETGPTFVASGSSTTGNVTYGTAQRKALSSWLSSWRKESRASRPANYLVQLTDASDDTDDEGPMSNNPLGPLLLDSEKTVQYVAIPTFSLDQQPLFVLLACFNERTVVEEECFLFIESSAAIIRSSMLRQAVMKADSQAHLFVQQVQHGT